METINPTAASLLGFLHNEPLTGYELSQRVASSIGYFWNVTRSQIYRELQTLQKEGFVKVGKTGIRDKRPFAITALGRESFREWLQQEPASEIIRFPLLLTMFFGDKVAPERLRRFAQIHQLRHAQRLDEYREIYKHKDQMTPYALSTLEFGIEYEKMIAAWFAKLKLPAERPGK